MREYIALKVVGIEMMEAWGVNGGQSTQRFDLQASVLM